MMKLKHISEDESNTLCLLSFAAVITWAIVTVLGILWNGKFLFRLFSWISLLATAACLVMNAIKISAGSFLKILLVLLLTAVCDGAVFLFAAKFPLFGLIGIVAVAGISLVSLLILRRMYGNPMLA